MTDAEKTAEIYKRLDMFYKQKFNTKSVAIKELRIGTGYNGLSQRSIDYFVISTLAGNYTTSYEVKASLSDFKKDIADLEKQKAARTFSNYFYYVAPVGVIPKELLPSWAGLYEVFLDAAPIPYGNGELTTITQTQIIKKIEAPYMENNPPSWGLLAEVIRNLTKA